MIFLADDELQTRYLQGIKLTREATVGLRLDWHYGNCRIMEQGDVTQAPRPDSLMTLRRGNYNNPPSGQTEDLNPNTRVL